MSVKPHITFLPRLAHRPVPVLLGVALGFIACSLAGRQAAQQQPFENFVRFHQGINPETHFYPSFSQVLNLARQHIQPGKVLVVVGGNSIFHGVGQRESQIWTRHLQELLGESYLVLNLALKGNDPFEFGGLIAERLAWEGLPVVFLTTTLDANIDTGTACEWEGRLYQYFFWDAWGKGLLPPDEKRDQWLNDDASWKDFHGSNRREVRYRSHVDGVVYASDLWNTVAYRHLCSIFSPLKNQAFWEAHRNIGDHDPYSNVPEEAYNSEMDSPLALKIMQGWIHTPVADALIQGNRDGEVAKMYRQYVPAALLHRTLLVFRFESAYYFERLPAVEQERYRAVLRRLPEVLDGEDLHVQVVGENYTERDYVDRSHFSEQGGRKLAVELAPSVRSIAGKLYGTCKSKNQGEKP